MGCTELRKACPCFCEVPQPLAAGIKDLPVGSSSTATRGALPGRLPCLHMEVPPLVDYRFGASPSAAGLRPVFHAEALDCSTMCCCGQVAQRAVCIIASVVSDTQQSAE